MRTNVCACVFAGKADKEQKGSDAKLASTKKTVDDSAPEAHLSQVKLESKYAPGYAQRRKETPRDFVVADPPVSPKLFWSEDDDDDYWGDPQPQDYEVPTWPDDVEDDKPIMVDDDGTIPMLEGESLEMKVLRESAKASLVKNYVWADSTKNMVEIPQSFQDAVS